MHLPYYPFRAVPGGMAFEFYSEGPRGRIRKGVFITPTGEPGMYNLAMGDLSDDGRTLDDTVRTDNGDRDLVLSTVARIVFDFCTAHPHLMVAATGSTPARTRLYQMGIVANLEAIATDFYVFGLLDGDWKPFEKSVSYEAFLVALKPTFKI